MTRISRFFKLVGMMNRAYDKDSRKLFRRVRTYLMDQAPRPTEALLIIDQIDLLLGDREPPFDMDDKN